MARWKNLRNELDRCHLIELEGSTGRVQQRTELIGRQHDIYTSLQVPEPPRFIALTPT